LTRQDFQIFEDGIQQRIAYFATVDQPFTVALVLDTSGSTELSLDNMQSAAIAFVGQLNPEDRVTVIAFDDKIKVLTEPTSDREALSRAIRRTRSGGSTRLFDAVDFVIKDALKGASGRKAVVLFTDGVDTASRKGTYESTLRLAEESESLIYPVSYRTFNRFGTGSPTIRMPGGRGGVILTPPFPGGSIPGVGGGPYDPDSRRADTYLQELALRSGGRFYRGDSLTNITQAFEWIADELRRQYSLGFYPKRQGVAGQRRKIKVRVRRPNLIALSRDSYVYSQPSPNKKEPDQKQPLSDDAKRSPLAAIP
jgi:VWFA-related protein